MTDQLPLFEAPEETKVKRFHSGPTRLGNELSGYVEGIVTLPPELDPPGARTGQARQKGEAGLERTATKNARLLERLAPIALELATAAGGQGITVTDVRKEGIRRSILTGHEDGNTMSALGALMRRAGLVTTGERRKSDLDCTHARPQVVWILAKYDPRL